ncbi:hypothetical protein A3I57_03830 [Candidatus Beckwithbacteria bacterium RIFCSPLOWO2_02_FULL_47_23]|uniref:Uncharacterized protein n=1 Tax=Candidatus Beckwithbacteria bacterium RIFCSPLOWO2_02_FULL_47_23 TaxID=1797463 RepID=A0A1F5E080_9BACT|nr:MAG: hypothetical protein A3I57_03830 [Candidatus Beckwithbacteria bacterium RIFCSPLOWO2_02_FULL_47_23]
MPEIKTIISLFAVLLSIVGYIPYLRDTVKGKTKPHVYSWFIWTLLTGIVYGLQVGSGAGVGSWVTLAVTIIGFVVFLFGMYNGEKDITATDSVFFILSLVALFLWLIAKQPILSVILVSLIDMLGFAPTIRKSWNKPYSETLFTYELGAFRHGLSFFALQNYNIVTWLYPITWALANALFSGMLILRRRQLR